VQRKREIALGEPFPFSVPAIASLPSLDLSAPVTFFVGENGSGKSTVLEGIAAAANLPAIASVSVLDDATLAAQRALAEQLRLGWRHRTHRGFFLRAEDFFGFSKYVARLRQEMRERLAAVDAEYQGRSELARALAAGPAAGSLAELERTYGADLDAASHGESFLKIFRARMAPDALYLLDEPETPLSPQNQLALLALIAEALGDGGQFIIATHSPILLAFPRACIYSFDRLPVQRVAYEELPHVTLTREFLNAPQRYLRHLIVE
jgi:predicted ATPase